MNAIGDRIKFLRKNLKITQKEFSERIHVTQSYLSRVESGKEIPTDMLLKLISLEFNISLEWLNGSTDSLHNFESDSYDRGSKENLEIARIDKIHEFANYINNLNHTPIDLVVSAVLDEFMILLNSEGKTNFSSFQFLIFEKVGNLVLEVTDQIKIINSIDNDVEDYKLYVYKKLQKLKNNISDIVDDIGLIYEHNHDSLNKE